MLTTEECPEMNVGTGKFSADVEMTVEQPRMVDIQKSKTWNEMDLTRLGKNRVQIKTSAVCV